MSDTTPKVREFDPTNDRFPLILGAVIPFTPMGKYVCHTQLAGVVSLVPETEPEGDITYPHESCYPVHLQVMVGTLDEHIAYVTQGLREAYENLQEKGHLGLHEMMCEQNVLYQEWLKTQGIDGHRVGGEGVEVAGEEGQAVLLAREEKRRLLASRGEPHLNFQGDPALSALFNALERCGLNGMTLRQFHAQLGLYLEDHPHAR